MVEKENKFTYTYSAKDQEEIKSILKKYLPPEENKMDQLRKLDESATKKGVRTSLISGVCSTLFLGMGMSCTMVWGGAFFIPGIFIGMIGIAGMGVTYPLYLHITKKEREKLAPRIMELTGELIK